MKIENQKLSIKEAFNNFYYVVPDYQREYIWGEDNVTRLLEDIFEEFKNNQNSEYFIGSIVVNKNHDGAYEVIDGQQRLTTLFLIMVAFREIFQSKGITGHSNIINKLLSSEDINNKGEVTNKIRLELQYIETTSILNDFFLGRFQENNYHGSARNIKNAFETIKENIIPFSLDVKDLKEHFGFLISNVNFIQIETPSVGDALKIFETINDRGVGLNPMDLLKNLIFRQFERKEFQDINNEWKKITKALEKYSLKPLRFLRYFLMANYEINDKRGIEVVREDEIYRWITDNDGKVKIREEPLSFINKLHEQTEAYSHYYKFLNLDGTLNIYLENIKFLGGQGFSQHLILLLSAKRLDKDIFNHLIAQMEALIFYYLITRTSTKELESKFSKWSVKLRRVFTYPLEKQKDFYNEFIKSNFEPEVSALSGIFETSFLDLTLNSLQKYKIKYILSKIAQYVDLMKIGSMEKKSISDYLNKNIQIEHILPNNPKSSLLDTFESVEEYDNLKIMLGNLTLAERPINIVASNNFFDLKKPLYKTSKFYLTKSIAELDIVGVNSSVNRINKELSSFEKWDRETIMHRQKMLLNLAKKVWHISEYEPK